MNLKKPVVHSIIKTFQTIGFVEAKRRGSNRKPKLNQDRIAEIGDWIHEDCSLSLKKISKKCFNHFNIKVSNATIFGILKDFHYSLKWIYYISEKRKDTSTIFLLKEYANSYTRLITNFSKKFIFIDDVGFNVSMMATRARLMIGFPSIKTVPSLRSRNISVCGAINKNGLIHCTALTSLHRKDHII